MKKLLILTFLLLGLSSIADAKQFGSVPMTYKPTGSTHAGSTKSPVRPWFIDLTDRVITMSATPCDYTLALYNSDGDVAYTVFVPAGTMQVTLPATLTGDFELRFEADGYYYFGFINL